MRLFVLVLTGGLFLNSASAACLPGGMPRNELLALKAAKWQVPDDARRQQLALGMVYCLADPDPVLRDEIGFEALSAWMRGDKLTTATVQSLRTILLPRLAAADPQGVIRPFAALTLAEVARRDRLKPYLSSAERQELLTAAAAYLSGVRDYRGYDEQSGWRHGVAHGADLMLQLALNPALGKPAHETILAAIASQVLPAHSYIYGEGERLMAPVFYLARQTFVTAVAHPSIMGTSMSTMGGAHRVGLVIGPLCRRVADVMPLLRVMAGPDEKDATVKPWQLGDPAAVALAQVSVFAIPDSGERRAHPVMRKAVERAAAALGARGARVGSLDAPDLRHGFWIWAAAMTEANPSGYADLLSGGAGIPILSELAKLPFGRSR